MMLLRLLLVNGVQLDSSLSSTCSVRPRESFDYLTPPRPWCITCRRGGTTLSVNRWTLAVDEPKADGKQSDLVSSPAEQEWKSHLPFINFPAVCRCLDSSFPNRLLSMVPHKYHLILDPNLMACCDLAFLILLTHENEVFEQTTLYHHRR